MDPKTTLMELEDLAGRIGLKIRYERFGDDETEIRSGRCRLRGEDIILMDRKLDTAGRIGVLSREIRKSNLGGVFIKPFLRALLEEDPRNQD